VQVAFRSLHRNYTAAASTDSPADMDQPLSYFWSVVQAKFPELPGSPHVYFFNGANGAVLRPDCTLRQCKLQVRLWCVGGLGGVCLRCVVVAQRGAGLMALQRG
jgi:hypothetical protein